MSSTLEQARSVKAELQRRLGSAENVVGIGITRVGPDFAVKVNLSVPMDGPALPAEIDGVPLRVEMVGPITPR